MKKLMIAAATVAMAVVAGAAEPVGAPTFEALTIKGKVLGQKKQGAAFSVLSTKAAGLYDVANKKAYLWNTDSKMKIGVKNEKGKAVKMFVCDDIIDGEIATIPGDAKKMGRKWSFGQFNGVAFGNAKSASGSYTITGAEYGTWKVAQDKTLTSLQKKNPSAGLVDVLLKKKVELESNLTAEELKAWKELNK